MKWLENTPGGYHEWVELNLMKVLVKKKPKPMMIEVVTNKLN
jgi:hypothetical protein